jgi:integration host factor subunit alpha
MIYSGLGMSKQECANVVDSVFEIMKDELSKGNDVMISGFGKWVVKKKTARVGRNPKTGEQMPIDARTVVTFKSSDKLRSEINHGS